MTMDGERAERKARRESVLLLLCLLPFALPGANAPFLFLLHVIGTGLAACHCLLSAGYSPAETLRRGFERLKRRRIPCDAALLVCLTTLCSAICSLFYKIVTGHLPLLQSGLEHLRSGRPLVVLSLCLSSLVLAPILEECVFRKILPELLQFLLSGRQHLSFLLSSLAFACLHRRPAAILGLTLFGLCLCRIRQRHGLLQGILTHAAYNLLVMLLYLASLLYPAT